MRRWLWSKDKLFLSLSIPEYLNNNYFIVNDLLGRETMKLSLKPGMITLHVDGNVLISGIYYYHVMYNGNKLVSRKIVKME